MAPREIQLHHRISATMLAVVLVPLLAVTIFALERMSNQLQEDEASHVHQVLGAGAQKLSAFLDSRRAEVGAYAQTPLMQSMDFARINPFLQSELRRHKGTYEKFILGTSNGQFYNTAGGNPTQGYLQTFDNRDPKAKPKSIHKRDYWKATVGQNVAHKAVTTISDPMISYTTGVKQVVVASAIRNDRGRVVGMIGGALPWEDFEHRILSIKEQITRPYSWNAKFFLVSRSGQFWYHWDPAKIVHLKKDSEGTFLLNDIGEKISVKTNIKDELGEHYAKAAQDISQGKEGRQLIEDKDGARSHLMYVPVDASGYAFGMIVKEDDLMGPIFRLRSVFIGVFVVALLLAGWVGTLLARRIAHPIASLTQLADAVKLNQPRPEQPMTDIYEVNSLRRALNSMIAELEQREINLAQSEERFQFAMKGANDGLWDWDLETDEVYYSPRWLSMLGYSPNDLAGHIDSFKTLLHPADKEAAFFTVQECIDGKRSQYEKELRLKHKAGHYVTVLSRAFLVRGLMGKATRLVGTHVDISDLKRTQERLQEYQQQLENLVKERTQELQEANTALESARDEAATASQARKEMIHMLCHDLTNPLGAARVILQCLPADESKREDRLTYINELLNKVLSIIDLTRKMMAIESNKVPMSIAPHSLKRLIDESALMFQDRFQSKGVTIDVEVDEATYVMVDESSFEHSVMNNLLSNALKFSHEGAHVRVWAERSDEWVCLHIQDEGIGMSETLCQQLFDVTAKTSRVGTGGEEGTGFGMPLVQKFVHAYGGRIEVSSVPKTEGSDVHGTTFRLYLTATEKGAEAPEAMAEKAADMLI